MKKLKTDKAHERKELKEEAKIIKAAKSMQKADKAKLKKENK